MFLSLSDQKFNGKSAWVAEIVGRHHVYNFDRSFLRKSRREGRSTFELKPETIYDISCPDENVRYFAGVHGRNGQLCSWSREELEQRFPRPESWLSKKATCVAEIGDFDLDDL